MQNPEDVRLDRSASEQIRGRCRESAPAFMAARVQDPNIVGMGAGIKQTGGVYTGEPALVVFVERKMPVEQLVPDEALPQTVDGQLVDVVEVGRVQALGCRPIPHLGTDHGDDVRRLAKHLRRARKDRGPIGQALLDDLLELIEQLCGDRPPPRTGRFRPAPPGVSVGHPDVTAGTLGLWVKDRETGEVMLLSNNHVIANSNSADVGDPIIQPGRHDGGLSPSDDIATLTRYTEILFGAQGGNRYDGAVAGDVDPADVDPEILQIGEPAGVLPVDSLVVGLAVEKSGRTTGLTRGTINTVGAVIRVGYGNGREATFEDQVTITPGTFSDGGDSGSSILDDNGNVAGLLFAGSDFMTVGSPIEYVFDGLGVGL